MKHTILRFAAHFIISFLLLAGIGISFGLYHGASLRYSEDPLMMNWDHDGPYIFEENDSTLMVNHIRGNQDDGFYVDRRIVGTDSSFTSYSFFHLDSTRFEFTIQPNIKSPDDSYDDDQPILAISDIESGFKTFRDFLITHQVIDDELNWTFGLGHLVLLGDFVDRGFSTTQVLWFIYKLEQDARQHGGTVHFILGNHEIKNMQGNFDSASPKYVHIASILGKKPHELYEPHSVLGRWMSSKNTVERINGILFSHGGLNPDLVNIKLTISDINRIVRENYYRPFYPKPEKTIEQRLISSHSGVAWYRGYFKDELAQEEIDRVLFHFDAGAIVVGHTLQSKVNARFNGKVIGIDVRHPKDYSSSFPNQRSEGLLIEGGTIYRLRHDGGKSLPE